MSRTLTGLVAAALVALFASPPYVRAAFLTGNPIFPFFNTIFKSPGFNVTTDFTAEGMMQ